MILTDREIQAWLRSGQIAIEPTPTAEMYSSTTVDLTLGNKIRTWTLGHNGTPGLEAPIISPAARGYTHDELAKHTLGHTLSRDEGHVFEPNTFILAWTKEYISLPTSSRVAARVEGKSSLARLAISVHMTAPTIHAGFSGQIQLEMRNNGPLRVRLLPDMRICQLIFEITLGTPEKGYAGLFANQTAT